MTEVTKYVHSFMPEDKERIFNFFALFSRWECALKRKFPIKGAHGDAQADWNAFADEHSSELSTIGHPGYQEARKYLLERPPLRLMYQGVPPWQPNPRREDKGENEARYFFRIIRDVRNNLFHGGKYQGGPMEELARDRKLLDSAIAVLLACIDIDPDIRSTFEERA